MPAVPPTLSASLDLGAVTLNVADLPEMLTFYRDVLGLTPLTSGDDRVVLGDGGRPVVCLAERPDLAPPPPGSAGLYHLAIVHATTGTLARRLQHVFQMAPDRFVGSADHLVSEAFYLADPESNGVELYVDRDAAQWQWRDGTVQMDARYIEPSGYVIEHLDESPGAEERRMGHVHLRVGDVAAARAFYVDLLGFTATAAFPRALFVSVGGYHHHLGLNSWESEGAGARGETLGLNRFDLHLAQADDLTALALRLANAGVATRSEGATVVFADPWGNRLAVSAG